MTSLRPKKTDAERRQEKINAFKVIIKGNETEIRKQLIAMQEIVKNPPDDINAVKDLIIKSREFYRFMHDLFIKQKIQQAKKEEKEEAKLQRMDVSDDSAMEEVIKEVFFPKIKVFLMSSAKNKNYKKSNNNDLYLYFDSNTKQIFYIHEDKKYIIESAIIGLNYSDFNQAETDAKPCSDKAKCERILGKVSHTHILLVSCLQSWRDIPAIMFKIETDYARIDQGIFFDAKIISMFLSMATFSPFKESIKEKMASVKTELEIKKQTLGKGTDSKLENEIKKLHSEYENLNKRLIQWTNRLTHKVFDPDSIERVRQITKAAMDPNIKKLRERINEFEQYLHDIHTPPSKGLLSFLSTFNSKKPSAEDKRIAGLYNDFIKDLNDIKDNASAENLLEQFTKLLESYQFTEIFKHKFPDQNLYQQPSSSQSATLGAGDRKGG